MSQGKGAPVGRGTQPRNAGLASLTLRDVGEFGLIDRIRALLEPVNSSSAVSERLQVGIGDDAAVWSARPDAAQVVTTDALVEGVHFDLLTIAWSDLGWKSLAVNLSDLGAMGATPELAVISIGLPEQTRVEDVDAFYQGLAECALRWRVAVVGGDIVSSPVLTINVTALGECTDGQLRRSAGKPGDLLAVTGWLGRSGGGLRLLEQGMPGSLREGQAGELLQAHMRPIPRIEAAGCLVEAGLRCGLDVSDGLRGDAAHICERSECSATIEIDRIPLHPALVDQFGKDEARKLALDGGEDYELLCAGPEEVMRRAARLAAERTGDMLTVIGRLEERREGEPLVRLTGPDGSQVTLEPGSWDHFRHG